MKAWIEKWAYRALATAIVLLVLSAIAGGCYLEYKKAVFFLNQP